MNLDVVHYNSLVLLKFEALCLQSNRDDVRAGTYAGAAYISLHNYLTSPGRVYDPIVDTIHQKTVRELDEWYMMIVNGESPFA